MTKPSDGVGALSGPQETESYPVQIFMAGDYEVARGLLRGFCYDRGYCFRLTRSDYIYTGGEESGFTVGLINYPRFPRTPEEIWRIAEIVTDELMSGLCQKSASIQAPDRTRWVTATVPGLAQ